MGSRKAIMAWVSGLNLSETLKNYKFHILGGGIVLVGGAIGGMIIYKLCSKSQSDSTESKVGSLNRQVFPCNIEGDENQNPGILIVHQCPRGRKTPCIAPYPLKLETFLRIHGIGYVVEFNSRSGATPQTGGPWITLNFEDIVDSQNCIKYLCMKMDIEPEENLVEEQKSISRAFSHLCENHLYWGIALHRWVFDTDPTNWKNIQYLSPESEAEIPKLRDAVHRAAWFHGIGKRPEEEVKEAVIQDLKSLSKLLGTKKYMFSNEKPSELDCTVFGLLAQILWTMEGTIFYNVLTTKCANLQMFCIRMRKEYWPDWEDCLLNTPLPLA